MILDNPRPAKFDNANGHSFASANVFGQVIFWDRSTGLLNAVRRRTRFMRVHQPVKNAVLDRSQIVMLSRESGIDDTRGRCAMCGKVAELVEGQSRCNRCIADRKDDADDRVFYDVGWRVERNAFDIESGRGLIQSFGDSSKQFYSDRCSLVTVKDKAVLFVGIGPHGNAQFGIFNLWDAARFHLCDHSIFLSDGEVPTPSVTGAGLASSLPRQGGAA